MKKALKMTSTKKNLGFARGTVGVNIKRDQEQQRVNLAEIFGSRGIDVTGVEDF